VQAAATFREPGAGEIAVRVLRRAVRKLALSPTVWLILALAIGALAVTNLRFFQAPLAIASPSKDAADQYVQALQTGNVDQFLVTLSPDARAELEAVGRFAGLPRTQAEQRAARIVLARNHIDGYTRLGQHASEDGSFVVYAIERNASDGTHTTPLVVWLDQDGQVVRSTF
jgi:hypothetical protein